MYSISYVLLTYRTKSSLDNDIDQDNISENGGGSGNASDEGGSRMNYSLLSPMSPPRTLHDDELQLEEEYNQIASVKSS